MKGRPFIFPCPWLLVLSFFSITFFVDAQNLKCKSIPTNQSFVLDSLIIEPGSITSRSSFDFDVENRVIRVHSTKDSVQVCYRVLSSIITQPFMNRDIANYDTSGDVEVIAANKVNVIEKEQLFDFGGIQKYGAITRGITFGNRQNLLVNSTLNLQMQGKLDEDLYLSAVITDQNVPYQPEGNTQQIRDFDNVYIKLCNDDFDITAGDIVLKEPQNAGYFLKYYKNIQGLQASLRGGQDWEYVSRVSGAVSKGKFNSALVEPIDGLSGPYKLRGPRGERFIIVLANSEKVFLDGERLKRGFDRDYVIDYNLGEITFNNHIIITQFSIIRVDYEYSEQFYNRSNISTFQSLEKNNVRLFANYYREKDNPNRNLGFSLNEADLAQLQRIGDNADQAFITGFDSVEFNENRVMYKQVDTVDRSGHSATIFQYSTDLNEELFSPTFSEVGFGNGNYILEETTVNGKVYEWVSPENGVPKGNYEPGSFIPLPNKKQLITIGGEVTISGYENVSVEGAFSQQDNNLYSELQDDDNDGQALFVSIKSNGREAFLPGYLWEASLSLEYDQKDFTFIDRYRPPLFDRNWNFNQNSGTNSRDLIVFTNIGLVRNDGNKLIFSLNRRERGNQINGWQQQLVLNQEFGNFRLKSTHFHLDNDQNQTSTSWIRSKSDVSYRKWKIVPGFIFEIDENKMQFQDRVISTLMNFKASEFYLSSGDSTESTFRFAYQIREDRLPVSGELQDYLLSRNFRGSYVKNGRKGRVSFDVNYRHVDDQLDLNEGRDEVINGRLNWSQEFLKSILRHTFSYSTGNSRELRREFVYLPVNTGEGTHTWRDNNGDGVQDLNEFFEAINPDERNYVKLFTPTDEYITSFQTFYLHTIDVRAPSSWRNQGGVKSFAYRFSANANLNVSYKTTSSDYSDRLNPLSVDLKDEEIISIQSAKRYTLFFNQNGRGFGADFTRQINDSKQLLTQGFETRERSEWISNFKLGLSSEYTFRFTSSFGSQFNRSDFLDSRNFDIHSNVFKPQLIWQPSNYLRLIGSYERKHSKNEFLETSQESSITQSYTGELTWNQTARGSIRATFSVRMINFEGDPSTYLGYILLDGLQPGINQTWQLNVQQRLSKGMQISLFYNGRKSEALQAIHTGNVQVTAFF
ncbi:MAG: hypothetical protein AAGI25_00425 [Bacteroidota bacterium]